MKQEKSSEVVPVCAKSEHAMFDGTMQDRILGGGYSHKTAEKAGGPAKSTREVECGNRMSDDW
jgi:hypothetical protein